MSANKKDLQRGRLAVVFDTEEGIKIDLYIIHNYIYRRNSLTISFSMC